MSVYLIRDRLIELDARRPGFFRRDLRARFATTALDKVGQLALSGFLVRGPAISPPSIEG